MALVRDIAVSVARKQMIAQQQRTDVSEQAVDKCKLPDYPEDVVRADQRCTSR